MTVELAPSRRERKKQATREAIHEAAFDLAEESGLGAVTVEAISENLYTYGQPDPDLVIRTSGEQRLSGFLLWP